MASTGTVSKQLLLPETSEFHELGDVRVLEELLGADEDLKRVRGRRKRLADELGQRVIEHGEPKDEDSDTTQLLIGEKLCAVSPKGKTEYDSPTLKSLENCVTPEQLWLTVRQTGSTRQFCALSDIAGAAAKSVIASAKRRIKLDELKLKIKNPIKNPKRRGGKRAFGPKAVAGQAARELDGQVIDGVRVEAEYVPKADDAPQAQEAEPTGLVNPFDDIPENPKHPANAPAPPELAQVNRTIKHKAGTLIYRISEVDELDRKIRVTDAITGKDHGWVKWSHLNQYQEAEAPEPAVAGV